MSRDHVQLLQCPVGRQLWRNLASFVFSIFTGFRLKTCPLFVPALSPVRRGHVNRLDMDTYIDSCSRIYQFSKKVPHRNTALKSDALTPKRDVAHLQYCTAQYTIRQEIFTFAKAQRQPGFDLIPRRERRVNTERAKTKGLRLQRSQAVDHLAGDGRDRPLFVCVMLGKYDQHEF